MPDERLFLSGSDARRNRKPKRSGRPGARLHDNKTLLCRICGYKPPNWMELWLIELHFSVWHDQDKVEFITSDNKQMIEDPIDMTTQAEITKMLDSLAAATKEARVATSEAHAVTKDLKRLIKESVSDIRKQIVTEVENQVAGLGEEAHAEMVAKVNTVVDQMADDWRAKLGLT